VYFCFGRPARKLICSVNQLTAERIRADPKALSYTRPSERRTKREKKKKDEEKKNGIKL
jgi:hypothetical protein